MKVLVVGIDSDIGYHIYKQHQERGDEVIATSRNRHHEATLHFEMANRPSWPKFPKIDRLYFTIGVGDGRLSRFEVMNVNAFMPLDFARYVAGANLVDHFVMLSSMWGSIANVNSQRAIYYRMSKAALNMGVATIAHQFPQQKWTLMHPGLVRTKMTENIHNVPMLEPQASAAGIIKTSDAVIDHFSFVEYSGKRVAF